MMRRLYALLFLLFMVSPAYAVGTIIAVSVIGLTAGSFAAVATAFAINMVVSAVISKALFSPNQPDFSGQGAGGTSGKNPGNRQQVPPATDNKLPVVYGSAWVGGQVVDLSITSDNQTLFYVMALSEVTNTNAGQTPDEFSFGDIYFGGKKCEFNSTQYFYAGIGTITAVGSNYIDYYGAERVLANGAKVTFSNSGSPTAYTIQSITSSARVQYTASNESGIGGGEVIIYSGRITFTTTISGAATNNSFYERTDNADYLTRVIALIDPSTEKRDTSVDGHLYFYLYKNGSLNPYNTSQTAISVMQSSNLTYKWDSSKLMSNCAFAIMKLIYNQDAGITGLQQTKFNVINARHKPGDCFYDYLINTRYGAALPASQIDSTSLTALNVYCDQSFTYTDYSGITTTQTRFRFDGVLETTQNIMQNLQAMSSCCDCLIKYNETTAKWGVIVRTPTYSVAMALNDSNIVSAMQITPIDLSSSFNVAEVKFPDKANQDSFNSATFDLAQIDPSLLFPNEPVNKQSLSLPLVNDDVRAQYLANRFLKTAREDLQVSLDINFSGLQLEAGDVVSLTNTNYGFVDKLFQLNKVTQTFDDNGNITVKLLMMEFNPSIYDDVSITQFTPSPNSGIQNPLVFGTVAPPILQSQYPSASVPYFTLSITTPEQGVCQYAEIWYSAFRFPTNAQLILVGTSQIQSSGNPWANSYELPPVIVSAIPAGNWYFFTRMVNSLGTSPYSLASDLVAWSPMTFQFADRYLSVRYADDANGGGFSTNPRNKTYFGIQNVAVATGSTVAGDYVWYPATFSTTNYLLICNRGSRAISLAVGNAGFNNLGGAFVPTESSVYDSTLWGALQDGNIYIDLDSRTGQLTAAGTTSSSSADGLLSVSNNTNGSMVVSLERFLNFGNGVYAKTFTASTLTIDIYGRVVGYTSPDVFNWTETAYTATAGQTVFSNNHIVGQVLVFRNGVLCSTSEYSETSTNVTFSNACAVGEVIWILEMQAISTSEYYEILNCSIVSSGSTTVVVNLPSTQIINAGDKICFASTQPDISTSPTPTQYTVQSVNWATNTITFTTSISGATAGFNLYRYRAAGSNYAPFSRWEIDVTGITTYTPTTFSFLNGFENIYVNGSQFSEVDYDLAGGAIYGFPSSVTGKLMIIQFAPNNYNVPCSNITNNVAYSSAGNLSYSFPNNPLSMQLYANGVIFVKGVSYDYTASSSGYNLNAAINNGVTLLNQQTIARDGAA